LLVTRPTSRPDTPPHTSIGGRSDATHSGTAVRMDHVGDRIRAIELVRGNQAQLGDWAPRGPAAPTR